MAISQLSKTLWKISIEKQFGRVLEKVRLLSANDGRCTAELTVTEELSNSFGTLHGGATATIVDNLSTVALITHKRQAVGVSVDMHVTYVNGAAIGEDVIIEANTLRAGKNLAFLEVYIKKKVDGTLVAKGSHTKFVGNETGNLLERYKNI